VRLPTPPRSILVICTRRIGDVLLATPVVRSLKAAYPEARIDLLVFDGTQGVLDGNPDIAQVITVAERPGPGAHLALIARLWRRYDLAVSLLAGDRPTLYAWAAGRRRIGTLADDGKSRWKQRLLQAWVPFDNLHTHTVVMNLRVVEQLGIAVHTTPVVRWSAAAERAAGEVLAPLGSARFAVLHVSPKFVYKSWTADGWGELAQALASDGLRVVIAGGASAQERRYVQSLLPRLPADALNLAGKVDLGTLACVLGRAALYVGTDTAVTHMAAALGTPTVALFGPSNPVKWGPWPAGFDAALPSPWPMRGSGRTGNVFLVQGETDCVPCLHEGCERHTESRSDCLLHLPASRVVEAARAVLPARAGAGA
jgi:heptosyltransferase III